MAKLQLFYPVKPLHVNQLFGANFAYYAKNFETNGHMGIDFAASHGQPVYAPCDGIASYKFDEHGGDGIYLRTNDMFDYKGGQAKFMVILWHLCSKDDALAPKIPCDGNWYPVKAGDLIAFADNSGAPFESSGDHLHFGLYPEDKDNNILELKNGFGGAIDPQPYFNQMFAQDIQTIQQAVQVSQEAVQIAQENKDPQNDSMIFNLLEKVGQLLVKIFGK